MQTLYHPAPQPVRGGPWYLLELTELGGAETLSPLQAAAGGWVQLPPHSLAPDTKWLVGRQWGLFRTRVSTFTEVGN